MMFLILLVWTVIAVIDLILVSMAIWHSYQSRKKMGMNYIIMALAGSGAYDVIILALVTTIVLRPTGIDGNVSTGTVLFTIANVLQTLPTIAFSAYIVGIFANGKGKNVSP